MVVMADIHVSQRLTIGGPNEYANPCPSSKTIPCGTTIKISNITAAENAGLSTTTRRDRTHDTSFDSQDKLNDSECGTASFGSSSSGNDSGYMFLADRNSTLTKTTGKRSLTVEQTWKDDTAMKVKVKEQRGESGSAVVKWIVIIVMAALLLACLVTVKLSVIYLTSQLSQSNWSQQTESDDFSCAKSEFPQYWAHSILLYIYLSVPPLVMLMRAVWYGLLDKAVPWPGKKAVLLAVLSAALESLGLCLMCYSVLGQYNGTLSVLLLATPLVVPAFDSISIVKDFHSQGRVKSRTVGFVAVGTLCLIGGLCCVGFLLALFHNYDLDLGYWLAGVAQVCLSLAWLPSLQNYISTTTTMNDSDKKDQDQASPTDTFSNKGITTNTLNVASAVDSDTSSCRPSVVSCDSRNMTEGLSVDVVWRTAFVVNGCRLFFTFIFSCLLFMLDSCSSPADVFTKETHQAFLDSWDLTTYIPDNYTWVVFGLGQGAGALAYCLAFVACHMNLANEALAPPLLLATPVSLIAVALKPLCESFLTDTACDCDEGSVQYVMPAAALLMLGHLLAFGWYLFRVDSVLLQQENLVFCVPGYNGVALDAWLTINRRRDVSRSKSKDKEKKKRKVYIWTIMYRENENEMRQLLKSIRLINEAKNGGSRWFQSHIIFDDGVQNNELSEFAVTLISLLEDTLGVNPKACTKVKTPYGLKLSWELPGPRGQRMDFNIHLKDSLLVKNKKRWSQVMYMSYVLDVLTKNGEEAFILTTDGDVTFTPESVDALLDVIIADSSIGAVCARTHPMGSGPVVWYQVFEYAIGHWLQKVAEFILGSVLVAPGCFSVYRCRALKEVLPQYATHTRTAFESLTKDMGEDRWLCTLLIQSGWQIAYCSVSESLTNCPSDLDEFFNQRRRWIASSLSNLILLLKEWKYVFLFNHRVSLLFLLYQGLLLFSTLIGPSTAMLFVASGLSKEWSVNPNTTVIVQLVACVAFTVLCLFTAQSTQLKVSKMYMFLYAIIMPVVMVGAVRNIIPILDMEGTLSLTPLYLGILTSIFIVTGLLHPKEMQCLLHGLWYVLCLPSGYLILTIYSICNTTDSSWGTREQAAEKSSGKETPWQKWIQDFFCCSRERQSTTEEQDNQPLLSRSSSMTPFEDIFIASVAASEGEGRGLAAPGEDDVEEAEDEDEGEGRGLAAAGEDDAEEAEDEGEEEGEGDEGERAQQKAIRQMIDEAPVHDLAESNVEENDFWNTLIEKCLGPLLNSFGMEKEIKDDLVRLRNYSLMILAVINTLWLTLFLTIHARPELRVFEVFNPMDVLSLLVLIVQFLAMMQHRLFTVLHYVAKAPFRCSRSTKNTRSTRSTPFKQDLEAATSDWTETMQITHSEERAGPGTECSSKTELSHTRNKNCAADASEITSLLSNHDL